MKEIKILSTQQKSWEGGQFRKWNKTNGEEFMHFSSSADTDFPLQLLLPLSVSFLFICVHHFSCYHYIYIYVSIHEVCCHIFFKCAHCVCWHRFYTFLWRSTRQSTLQGEKSCNRISNNIKHENYSDLCCWFVTKIFQFCGAPGFSGCTGASYFLQWGTKSFSETSFLMYRIIQRKS